MTTATPRDTVILLRPENVYAFNHYPPLNLLQLATVLQRDGFRTEIVNAALLADPEAELTRLLPRALLVGISVLTAEMPAALRLLRRLRGSGVPVAAGGWHITLFPEQAAASGLIDYTITGEGETALLALCRQLRDGCAPPAPAVLRAPVEITALPAPDYTLTRESEHFITAPLTDPFYRRLTGPVRWLPYETSRGCPSECAFCINVVAGNRHWRAKRAATVIADVAELVRRHGITHVKFIDDNFFVDVPRARQIASGLLAQCPGITWDAECRCDYFRSGLLDDETLALLRRSGLVQLILGIESGSPHTLCLMRKGITPQQAEQAVAACDRHDIIPHSSFMLDVPGETPADLRATVALINRLRRYPRFACGVVTFRPYPRCALTGQLQRDGVFAEPADFAAWAAPEIIELYTAAELRRPWQVDGEWGTRAAYYQNMESTIRLGDQQLASSLARGFNRACAALARLRNRRGWYALPLDKALHRWWQRRHYRGRGEADRQA